jgi:hypothetical protein
MARMIVHSLDTSETEALHDLRTEAERQALIAALLEERIGLERRGLTDRVAAVDEALAHHGYTEPTKAA